MLKTCINEYGVQFVYKAHIASDAALFLKRIDFKMLQEPTYRLLK